MVIKLCGFRSAELLCGYRQTKSMIYSRRKKELPPISFVSILRNIKFNKLDRFRKMEKQYFKLENEAYYYTSSIFVQFDIEEDQL